MYSKAQQLNKTKANNPKKLTREQKNRVCGVAKSKEWRDMPTL